MLLNITTERQHPSPWEKTKRPSKERPKHLSQLRAASRCSDGNLPLTDLCLLRKGSVHPDWSAHLTLTPGYTNRCVFVLWVYSASSSGAQHRCSNGYSDPLLLYSTVYLHKFKRIKFNLWVLFLFILIWFIFMIVISCKSYLNMSFLLSFYRLYKQTSAFHLHIKYTIKLSPPATLLPLLLPPSLSDLSTQVGFGDLQ